MTIPIFHVDFNEMLELDLVLLSQQDYRQSINLGVILLEAGMKIIVTDDDVDELGRADNLLAHGFVELNVTMGWAPHVKWCCRIDPNGIRHESDTIDY